MTERLTIAVFLIAALGCGRSGFGLFDIERACLTSAPPGNHVYRSVGPADLTALATGERNRLSIWSDDVAHFEASLPASVGVGDVLQFDSDGDAEPDQLASITRRLGPTGLLARPLAGGSLSHVRTEHWSIFRAYLSLADALAGNENPAINPALADFDTWQETHDLARDNQVWHLACYGGAVDDQRVDTGSWTTGPQTYLRMFTPVDRCEVGASQRHRGVWRQSAYTLAVTFTGCCRSVISLNTDYARVEGLQIHVISTTSWNHGIEVATPASSTASEVDIHDNLVRATLTGDTHVNNGIHLPQSGTGVTGAVTKIWNNVIYDFVNNDRAAAGIELGNVDDIRAYVHNNTVINCQRGIAFHYGTAENVLTNNLVQGSVDVDYRDYGDGADRAAANLSSDDSSPNEALRNQVVQFRNARGRDLRLVSTDVAAIDRGIAMDDDGAVPFSVDFEGQSRPQGAGWDIGADELLVQ